MYDYLIVGAGLFGAVFAQCATQAGKRCLVIDRRGHIGGNVYTETVEGIHVHRYGAHIFHTSHEEVWQYVQRFARFLPFVNAPIADTGEAVYNLPFNMNTFARLWGVKTPDQAKAILRSQIEREGIGCPRNLEEQALKLVGRDLYETFIRGYTEKQWGRPCAQLPAFIIRRIPLRFTYDNNYFTDRYQGIPEGGYTPMVEKMLAGCDVRLHTEYAAVADQSLARKVVYTGPIDAFYGYRLGVLEYRSLRFSTEVLDTDNYQGNAVVNHVSASTPYTRVIEHKHFAFGQQEKTVISREYPCEWQKGLEPYYPVNDQRNDALYRAYAALAEKEEHVLFGGRLAEYRYYDMDQVILRALACARQELGGKGKKEGVDL